MLTQQKGLFLYAAVVQLVELVPSKHDVAGSSPVDGSIQFQNDFKRKEQNTSIEIVADAFEGCTNLTTINVPWAEGAVANAPWGATNATINYNCMQS